MINLFNVIIIWIGIIASIIGASFFVMGMFFGSEYSKYGFVFLAIVFVTNLISKEIYND